jgi:hypothetical protein
MVITMNIENAFKNANIEKVEAVQDLSAMKTEVDQIAHSLKGFVERAALEAGLRVETTLSEPGFLGDDYTVYLRKIGARLSGDLTLDLEVTAELPRIVTECRQALEGGDLSRLSEIVSKHLQVGPFVYRNGVQDDNLNEIWFEGLSENVAEDPVRREDYEISNPDELKHLLSGIKRAVAFARDFAAKPQSPQL